MRMSRPRSTSAIWHGTSTSEFNAHAQQVSSTNVLLFFLPISLSHPRVGIETTHGESTNAYLAATRPIREEPSSGNAAAANKPTASPVPPSDSDSDSN